ncbi:MAG: mitochondrial fission ELM1 family protein [Pseudomonadota bacterium]
MMKSTEPRAAQRAHEPATEDAAGAVAGRTLTRPLEGLRGWIISDGKAGSESQATGIATALGLAFEVKRVAPGGLYRLIAPWGPPDPKLRLGEAGSDFAPPWPDVAIAIGRRSAPVLRALRHRSDGRSFAVMLLDPKAGRGIADVIWVPEHDRLRGDNVITTPTSPHPFTPERLAALRSQTPPEIAALAGPRVAVLVGGRTRVFRYTDADHARFAEALDALGAAGASLMITTSRRTHAELADIARAAAGRYPSLLFDGDGPGPNPYAEFLAQADAIFVTADSISMTGEAAATGRPVHVFHPSRGSAKFDRFHRALEAVGATRRWTAAFDEAASLFEGGGEPIDPTAEIAREIGVRYNRWRRQHGVAEEK